MSNEASPGAPSNIHDGVEESVAHAHARSIAEQAAMLSNLAYANLVNNINLAQQNALSNQQAMNQLGLTVTGKVVNLVANVSPMEVPSLSSALSAGDLAKQIADLKATLEALSTSTAAGAGDKAGGE